MNIKIDTTYYVKCPLCQGEHRDGDIVWLDKRSYRTFLYCSNLECHPNLYSNILSPQALPYYIKDKAGYLCLTKETFAKLGYGFFELAACADKVHFYIQSFQEDNGEGSIDEFFEKMQKGNYLLSKRDKYSNYVSLFLPNSIPSTGASERITALLFSPILKLFKSVTGSEQVTLSHDSNDNITGFCTLSATREQKEADTKEMQDKKPKYNFNFSEKETPKKSSKNKTLSEEVKEALETLTPSYMLHFFEKRICGQGIQLKKAVYLVHHYLEQLAADRPFNAENWVLTAPSGSGKTEFFRCVRDLFKQFDLSIPVVQIDLSMITEAGFKGTNVDTIPKKILAENPDAGGVCICFLDEADKKCMPSYTSSGDDVNAAVQSNLLTLVEGSSQQVEYDSDSEDRPFDSSKCMFVLMGAFQNIRNKKLQKATKQASLGFLADASANKETSKEVHDSFYEDVTIQDMIDVGMLEELAGRMVQVINFHKLSIEDMLALLFTKAEEISADLQVQIILTETAAEEFLQVCYGSLGIRRPMNLIKELAQNAIAEVYFEEDGYHPDSYIIIIDSISSAHIVRYITDQKEDSTSKHSNPPSVKC